MKIRYIYLVTLLLALSVSCQKDEIMTFDLEDAGIYFQSGGQHRRTINSEEYYDSIDFSFGLYLGNKGRGKRFMKGGCFFMSYNIEHIFGYPATTNYLCLVRSANGIGRSGSRSRKPSLWAASSFVTNTSTKQI